jgi:hypothetical protein
MVKAGNVQFSLDDLFSDCRDPQLLLRNLDLRVEKLKLLFLFE